MVLKITRRVEPYFLFVAIIALAVLAIYRMFP